MDNANPNFAVLRSLQCSDIIYSSGIDLIRRIFLIKKYLASSPPESVEINRPVCLTFNFTN
jgi:hypothetical protein